MKQRKPGAVVGFIVTPEEIENRVKALDASVQALARDVAALPAHVAPSIGAAWRQEFNAFLRRWALERDSYASWGSRLFATRVMPSLDEYTRSYTYWARDFEKKTKRAPSVPLARPTTGLADSLVPTELWWILGACALFYVATNPSRYLR